MKVEPGIRYQSIARRSPVRPEHASVIAHQRAYTAGGVKRSAFAGSGPAIKLHPATPPTTTNATHSASWAEPDQSGSRGKAVLIFTFPPTAISSDNALLNG